MKSAGVSQISSYPFSHATLPFGGSGNYSISFNESGLPIGTTWKIEFNGAAYQTNSASLTITNQSSGNYSWHSNDPVINTNTNGKRFSIRSSSGSLSIPNVTSVAIQYGTQFFLNLIAEPGGNVSFSASHWYNSSAIVNITATPSYGHNFTGWVGIGIGSYSGLNDPAQVVLISPVNETATFGQTRFNYEFKESGLPGGNLWSINLSGNIQSSTNNTIIFNNLLSGNYTWSASYSNSSGNSKVRYSPGVANGAIQIPRENFTTISYATQYYLTMKVIPSGSGSTAPTSGWFDSGSRVSISNMPNQGFEFSNWTGSGSGSYSGTSAQLSLTMNGPIVETAEMTPLYAVIFTEHGLPAGITWKVTFNGTTLNSSSNSLAFVAYGTGAFGWSVDSQIAAATGVQYKPNNAFGTVVLPADASSGTVNITITYSVQYYVSITTTNGGGTVTPQSGWYNAGYNLPIFATPSPGFNFTGFQVSNSTNSLPMSIGNSSTELIVTVDGPGTVNALFALNPTHGQAQSNNVGLWYAMTHNAALENPYVQLGGVTSIIVIVLAGTFIAIKRSFGKE